MAIYVITMVCLPIALAFMMDKIIWPISYGILLAVGVMIGGSEFFQYFIGGTSIPGLFLGAIADVINLVLGIFIADYSGTWLTALGQIVGHLGTVTILASPGLIIETAVADSAKGKKSEMSSKVDSMTSSVLDHDFYGEAKRDYHQQEELEALRRIERNLRGKKIDSL